MKPVIVWFRRDLRLQDNAAWTAAIATGKPVVPVYIHSAYAKASACPGEVSRWWLHHALEDLAKQLKAQGCDLVLMKGEVDACFRQLADAAPVSHVYFNRCYEPELVREESELEELLNRRGIAIHKANSVVLVEPDNVLNGEGNPFKVYSAFARSWSRQPMEAPIKPASAVAAHAVSIGVDLTALELITGNHVPDLETSYRPSRAGAEAALETFLNGPVNAYKRDRDYPAIKGTSGLSPYLHWGQIGPREIHARTLRQPASTGSQKFISELAWREFAYYILHHFPHTVDAPFRKEYENFAWREDGPELQPWKDGMTGFPLVDAGMRELARTGNIHNRVRMLVASFLVKHLLISWQTGADWFMKNLVDADLANNTLGWQWVAGCGVDAAPYFRIFNPVLQSKKFDGKGHYIRSFIPELREVPDKYIHEPWLMPDAIQHQSSCSIGRDYPEPICGLMEGRIRALAAWKSFSSPEQQTLEL